MTKSRYYDYPDHPLRWVNQELLDVVQRAFREVLETGDARVDDEEMIEPITDSIVQAVLESGWRFQTPQDCEAVIWHGPGHQSKTKCEAWSLQHDTEDGKKVHFATPPSNGYYEWTDDENFAPPTY